MQLKRNTITHINNNSSAPAVPAQWRLGHAHLVNLEPALALAVAGGEGAGALVHPDHDGALLVCPLGPDGGDVLPGRDGGAQCSRRAAVASHLGVGDGHNGVVVGPLPLDGRRRSCGRVTGVTGVCTEGGCVLVGTRQKRMGLLTFLILVLLHKYLRRANLVTSDGSMTSDQGGTREGRGEDVKLHSSCDMSRDGFLAKNEMLFNLSINLDHSGVTPMD